MFLLCFCFCLWSSYASSLEYDKIYKLASLILLLVNEKCILLHIHDHVSSSKAMPLLFFLFYPLILLTNQPVNSNPNLGEWHKTPVL